MHDRFTKLGAARAMILLVLAIVTAASAGCENAGQGAVTGAGVGALSGLAIGSISGSAGKGALIGAVAGGVGGAVIGDQNKRKAEQAAARQPEVSSTPPRTQTVVVQQPYNTGSALGRLVGNWNVTGNIETPDGPPITAQGTARAVIDKVYFVRIDLHFADPRSAQGVDGTSIISQTGNRGLEMTNSFSSSPETKHFKGEMDPSGNVFTFSQVTPKTSRKIVFRLSGDGFVADVWDGSKRVESYTFKPAS